jgi:hypothetical protein
LLPHDTNNLFDRAKKIVMDRMKKLGWLDDELDQQELLQTLIQREHEDLMMR